LKATLTLDQVRNYCVQDGQPIPIERLKLGAVTCSKACEKARGRQRMLLMEQKECKYCRRPSTPEERESFKAWRAWVKDQGTPKIALQATAESTEYPYTYKGSLFGRRGQRCRKVGPGTNGLKEQVEFEDGQMLVVDKMTVSGTKKKYSEKRGRPAATKSTLAAKQENSDQVDEGE
jgi:hypothetical protein